MILTSSLFGPSGLARVQCGQIDLCVMFYINMYLTFHMIFRAISSRLIGRLVTKRGQRMMNEVITLLKLVYIQVKINYV